MLPSRRWYCPEAQAIAGYVDGLLTHVRRSRVQRHLADCAYCRELVADLVRAESGAEAPEAPASLVEKACAVVTARPRRSRRIWMPAAAVGTAVLCTFIATTLLRPSRPFAPPPVPTPAATAILETHPLPPGGVPDSEIVRNQKSPLSTPSILSPKAGSTVTLRPLTVEWQPVLHTVYYQIRIVTSEGDLAWEGQSTGTALNLPANVLLKSGNYFVLLSAIMEDGRIRKSDPVGFQISGSR